MKFSQQEIAEATTEVMAMTGGIDHIAFIVDRLIIMAIRNDWVANLGTLQTATKVVVDRATTSFWATVACAVPFGIHPDAGQR